MDQIDMNGIETADKKREIMTIRLIEKYYLEEYQKLKSTDPISRRSLIEKLLLRAKSSGMSDSAVMSAVNSVLDSINLPSMSDGTFSFLQSNGTIGNSHADISVIIGINQLFQKFSEPEHYYDVPLARPSPFHDVPPIYTELSTNEQEAIQKGNIEKMKERALNDFFRESCEEWSVVQNALVSIPTIAEFIKSRPRITTSKLYESYCTLYAKFEHKLADHGGIVKPHKQLSEELFERVLDSLQAGEGYNVPNEIRLFVITALQ